MLHVVRVAGASMSPTLVDGDFVVVLGRRVTRRCRIGDVVVVDHPSLGRIVKRIAARDARGRIALAGDGPLSTTREAIGWLSERAVVGRVCLRVSKRRRARDTFRAQIGECARSLLDAIER